MKNVGIILGIALICSFSFSLIVEIVQKCTLKGKVIGVFDHAVQNDKEKIPHAICFKYEVDGKNYYFESKNVIKETDFSYGGPKIKLIYDLKDPSMAVLDDGIVGLFLHIFLLIFSVIASKFLLF